MTRWLPFLLILLLPGLPAPVAAQTQAEYRCSTSMLATVRQKMPHRLRDLDPAALSCSGLAQAYILLTSTEEEVDTLWRQRLIAVFRREGLTP